MQQQTILVCAALALAGAAEAQQLKFQPRMGEPLQELSPSQLAAFVVRDAELAG